MAIQPNKKKSNIFFCFTRNYLGNFQDQLMATQFGLPEQSETAIQ